VPALELQAPFFRENGRSAHRSMELSSRFKCCRVILKSFAYRAGIQTY
jgi:hypothetical protein